MVVARMGKFTGITTACTATAETNSHLHSTRREKIVDQIVIGTPGTLKRWMTKDKALDTRHVKVLVFDEADQMLDQVSTDLLYITSRSPGLGLGSSYIFFHQLLLLFIYLFIYRFVPMRSNRIVFSNL